MPKTKYPYVIIRSQYAGVFAGKIVSRKNQEVVLNDCRRLWYWSGAASLSQLAVDGVSNPRSCKFTVETQGHLILGVIEVIPTTAKAERIIRKVEKWEA